MTIAFEPKDGLMAGTFEIERTIQKTPEESAKLAAAFKTEFVPPPDEEEPEDVVEAEEVETDEIEEASPREQQSEIAAAATRCASSKRRRRRRGGRGHGTDRPPQPQGPQNQHHHTQPVAQPVLHAEEESAQVVNGSAEQAGESVQTLPQSVEGQPGAPRKKRRRRRGSAEAAGIRRTRISPIRRRRFRRRRTAPITTSTIRYRPIEPRSSGRKPPLPSPRRTRRPRPCGR